MKSVILVRSSVDTSTSVIPRMPEASVMRRTHFMQVIPSILQVTSRELAMAAPGV